MKKLFLFIFALLLINPILVSQWQTYNVAPSGRFYDVCVVTPDLIWATGDSARVYKSTNSGVSWQLVNTGLPNLSVLQITAIDANKAWINLGTRVFATTNSGTSWSEQLYSPITFINKIHFFNQNTGYLLADQQDSVVGFFVTRNGGANWDRSANSPVLGSTSTMWINDNGANSIDSNFVWFVAKGPAQVYSRLYKLTGGLNGNWQYNNIGSSPGQYSYSAFKNTNTGLVTSGSGIMVTTNGGSNWSIQNNTLFNDVGRDIMIVPGTDWVIQTGMYNIRLSKDLCANWQNITTAGIYSFCDAKDTSSIWVASSGGKLLKYNISYIGINHLSTEIPDKFILYQNYPNPFNPVTSIKIDVMSSGKISFRVYDLLGRNIYSLNEYKDAGTYEIIFNGNDFASGIYYYSIEANGLSDVKKMVLLK